MQWFHRAWRIIRWPLGILVVLYIGIVIFSIPHALEKIKTEETVARIHSQKLTIENMNGEHLPPPPDPAQVDATVEGIDANQNGIRDDVELAIFEKYPNDAKIRAAELQYAMTEQMYLTEVFNEETWKAVAEQSSRASTCITLNYSRADLKAFLRITDARTKEVESLVFNTQSRKGAQDKAYKFTTSFGTAPGQSCDVDLNVLLD